MKKRTALVGMVACMLAATACSTTGGGGHIVSADGSGGVASSTPDGATIMDPAKKLAAPDDAIPCRSVRPRRWKVAPERGSMVDETLAGSMPRPPKAGTQVHRPNDVRHYTTVDSYLSDVNMTDKPSRRRVMIAAGFSGGITTEFHDAALPHYVWLLTFRDSAGALDYTAARLSAFCANDLNTPVAGRSEEGGVALYFDEVGFGVALFVVGNTEVEMSVCNCTHGQELMDQTYSWYRAWMDHFADGKPAKVP